MVALFLFCALRGVLDTLDDVDQGRQRDAPRHAQHDLADLPAAARLPRAARGDPGRQARGVRQLVRRAATRTTRATSTPSSRSTRRPTCRCTPATSRSSRPRPPQARRRCPPGVDPEARGVHDRAHRVRSSARSCSKTHELEARPDDPRHRHHLPRHLAVHDPRRLPRRRTRRSTRRRCSSTGST